MYVYGSLSGQYSDMKGQDQYTNCTCCY